MLSAFPMEKEDILEVASIAVHSETHFPTASKALLDKCTSLLVSTMHTAEDVACFAEQVHGRGGGIYVAGPNVVLVYPALIYPLYFRLQRTVVWLHW